MPKLKEGKLVCVRTFWFLIPEDRLEEAERKKKQCYGDDWHNELIGFKKDFAGEMITQVSMQNLRVIIEPESNPEDKENG